MADFHYKDAGCSGPDLVPGAARGNRTFFLSQDGYLRGVTYRQPWVDGENVARCLVARPASPVAGTASTGMCAYEGGWTLGGVHFPAGLEPPSTLGGWVWNECGGVDPECACGFYAYHVDGLAGYGFTGAGHRVSAIIEGYGKVVLGTQGFRASKARIVAMVVPTVTELQRQQWDERREYQRAITQMDALLQVPYGRVSNGLVLGVGMALAGWATAHYWPPAIALSAVALAAGGVCEGVARRTWARDLDNLRKMRADAQRELDAIAPSTLPEAVERLVQNYPSVAKYEDRAAMWRDWPVENLAYLVTPPSPAVDEEAS